MTFCIIFGVGNVVAIFLLGSLEFGLGNKEGKVLSILRLLNYVSYYYICKISLRVLEKKFRFLTMLYIGLPENSQFEYEILKNHGTTFATYDDMWVDRVGELISAGKI